jgi:hypothetical protein
MKGGVKFPWILKHHRIWRISTLVLLLVSFLGPWTFDLIHVPSEYMCSDPYLRISDDFCGIPLSGVWLYRWMARGLIYASIGLLAGELTTAAWMREFIFSLLISLSLLPFFTTLLLLLLGCKPRRQVFSMIAWVFAIGFSLFWGLNNYPKFFWAVWGIWLYTGLALSALIMEYKISRRNKHWENRRKISGGWRVMD